MAVLSTSNNDLKVMNAALALLGKKKIGSFTETSLAARTGNALYADTLEEALSIYPWRFARDRVEIQRSNKTPPEPWTGLYTLSNNDLAVVNVYRGDFPTKFDIFGRLVAVNNDANSTDKIYAEVTRMIGPDQWASYFRKPFIQMLAGVLAMPVTQDEKTAVYHTDKAEKMMKLAQSRDAQGRTPSRIDTGLLVRAKRGARY